MTRLEHDRSIREWWNTLDQVALSSDEMLVIADELMDPESRDQPLKEKRRKWFTYLVLNTLASSFVVAQLGVTRSYDDTVGGVRHHLRRLLVDPDTFRLSQSGYETDFSALCREVRQELISEQRDHV
jgi:hypothetical protein